MKSLKADDFLVFINIKADDSFRIFTEKIAKKHITW